MAEDEMVGWHHQFKGHEFEQTPGNSEEQGSQAHCNPQGLKKSDMIEQLNNKRCQTSFSLYQININKTCMYVRKQQLELDME